MPPKTIKSINKVKKVTKAKNDTKVKKNTKSTKNNRGTMKTVVLKRGQTMYNGVITDNLLNPKSGKGLKKKLAKVGSFLNKNKKKIASAAAVTAYAAATGKEILKARKDIKDILGIPTNA